MSRESASLVHRNGIYVKQLKNGKREMLMKTKLWQEVWISALLSALLRVSAAIGVRFREKGSRLDPDG